mmetsp:Transcript_12836/g.22638  ORF Transcript_12836/g.22638 Transcript_12836/m.22638 type:complete len:320 (-) Transcript_12836:267-1226(-)|eukprot:CAMPEP_0119103000 /NCGR_PEP_ID=MMETSP1180-20130426/1563_1 /TAXON_ID=3052 ORGANISM="Chlamydomonas cf sp, Strain CCMP681" /NCGR_SAMPLE_ID=MMETSP1180 /ASSEMBLY_ACC=CAM_ASM_000741 /LENGTH=319 /DNA_ID=CAMNT_0007087403 /DNA_START=285 /DNA_END=1244 /DNA_ORIENTATION=-
MRNSPGPGHLAQFGTARLLLLVTFVLLSGSVYLYVDKHTMTAFLHTVQTDPYGYIHMFTVTYAVSVVVLFPCMLMQLLSGALYGFWMGLVVSWVATSTGQSLAFLLGRYLFRPTVKNYLHSTWPSFPTIDAAMKKEGWKLVCLLRLSPVLPYNILNYALGVTPVPFWVFTAASAFATVPWTALYVYLGTLSTNLMDLAQGKIHSGKDMHVMRQVLTGLFVVGTTVYGYIWSHKAIKAVLKDAADADIVLSANNSSGSNEAGGISGMSGSGGGSGTGGTISINGVMNGNKHGSAAVLSTLTERGSQLLDLEVGHRGVLRS